MGDRQQGFSGLKPDAFWSAALSTEDAVVAAAIDDGFAGVALDAPRRVPLQREETLPLIVLAGLDLADLPDGSYDTHGVLVGVNLDDSRVTAAPAVIREDEFLGDDPLDIDPLGGPEPVGGGYFEVLDIEAREPLGIEWQPSEWVFYTLLRNTISAPARVSLVNAPAAYKDEAVESWIEAQRARPSGRDPSPEVGESEFPNYGRINKSPDLPDEVGLALRVPPLLVVTWSAVVPLQGAFRLPIRPHERRPGGAAVIGISLVVVGHDDASLTVAPLDVPATDIDGDGNATGWFNIDLLAVPGMPRTSQSYHVYAFAGETYAGPETTRLGRMS